MSPLGLVAVNWKNATDLPSTGRLVPCKNPSSLEALKVNLDGALSTWMQLEISLITAGELDKMTFESLFQPSAICETVNYLSQTFPCLFSCTKTNP